MVGSVSSEECNWCGSGEAYARQVERVYPCNVGMSQDRVCLSEGASGAKVMRYILDELSEFALLKTFYIYKVIVNTSGVFLLYITRILFLAIMIVR